jgi:hypothetical protein
MIFPLSPRELRDAEITIHEADAITATQEAPSANADQSHAQGA